MAHGCVMFCTNNWRYKEEKERAKNCIFISFLRTRNQGKSGSTVIDGKFAKLLCHTEQTLPSAMTVY